MGECPSLEGNDILSAADELKGSQKSKVSTNKELLSDLYLCVVYSVSLTSWHDLIWSFLEMVHHKY